jgi:copper homeostasis protein (lipoprotein)
MKKLVLVFIIAAQLVSCTGKKKEEVSKTKEVVAEKSVSGEVLTYQGTLPCADCEGLETVLKIDQGDGTMENHKFELSSIYKGKTPEKEFVEKGTYNTERGFEDDADGTIYVLNYDKPQADQIYYGTFSKNPEKIYLLDNTRKRIKSEINYSLTLKK